MKEYELLLGHIDEALKLSDQLSRNENDTYARCTEALLLAKKNAFNAAIEDRSAECKCPCHSGSMTHFFPCECYSGKPYL